jgi:hypothetical protein
MSRFSKIAELAGNAVAPVGGLLAQGAFQAIEGFIPGE